MRSSRSSSNASPTTRKELDVDARGKTIAQGREVADLLERHGARARAVWKEAAPPAKWDQKGFTKWDFGELSRFAPELKTPVSVSVAKLKDALAALR